MGQASITLNGRVYRLNCADGEEARLRMLIGIVSEKLEGLAREFGQVGDDRLLMMAALMLADELVDAKSKSGAASRSE